MGAEARGARVEPPAWLELARDFPQLGPAFPSAHFGAPHLAELRASPVAERAYRGVAPGTEFAPGSWLVESLRSAESGRPGPTLALERRRDAWWFWIVEPDGRAQRGEQLEPCAGCHAAAPAAPVFGLRRTAESIGLPARSSP